MPYCLLRFACSAADMCRKISTRDFRQKGKSIVTGFGPHRFYRRAWHIAQPIDLEILRSAAKHFVGTHNFADFAANRGKSTSRRITFRGKPEPSTMRTINSVRVRQKGSCLAIEFDGNGFLYKMVRLMVGALVKCALNKARIEEIALRLQSGKVGSTRFAAPAEGLYLVRVRY
jgi:tRNA pseudouridine38-40 synthase